LRAVVMVGTYALLPLLLEGLVTRNLRDGLAEAREVNLVSDLPARPTCRIRALAGCHGARPLVSFAPAGRFRRGDVVVDMWWQSLVVMAGNPFCPPYTERPV
jgi:hypothetical protein